MLKKSFVLRTTKKRYRSYSESLVVIKLATATTDKMTNNFNQHQSDLLLSNMHFTSDAIEFAISLLPKLRELILSISECKIEKSQNNVAKYNNVMMDIAAHVNANTVATFFISHIFKDLQTLMQVLRQVNLDNRRNEKSRQNTLNFISSVCQSHYNNADHTDKPVSS